MHQDLVLAPLLSRRPSYWSFQILFLADCEICSRFDLRNFLEYFHKRLGQDLSSESIRCRCSHISVYLGSNACIISSVMTWSRRITSIFVFAKFGWPLQQGQNYMRAKCVLDSNFYTPWTSTSTNSLSSWGSRRGSFDGKFPQWRTCISWTARPRR